MVLDYLEHDPFGLLTNAGHDHFGVLTNAEDDRFGVLTNERIIPFWF